jgi:hypothetical protein
MPRLTTSTAAPLPAERIRRVAPRHLALLGALAVAGAGAAACEGANERRSGGGAADGAIASQAQSVAVADGPSGYVVRAPGRATAREAAPAAPPPSPEGSLAAAGVIGGGSATGDAFATGQSGDYRDADAAPDMVIRSGTASVQVDSIDVAVQRVRQLAQRVGGVIANSSLQGGRDQVRTATLEVKVAAPRFDDLVTGLAPFGKVESVNVTAEEVGEEYVDISARVANAHRLEARLIDLLATRTGKLSDVLTVERELARVREEIERYEGRMRYLKTRASVSTLTIAVHERAPVIVPVAGDGPILMAFRQAWENFVGVVAGFVASLGILIPLGALVFVAWLGLRRYIPWRPSGGTPPAAGAITGD